jgi:hypothetical protein
MRNHALLLAAVASLLAAGCTPDGTGTAVTPSAPQTSVAPASPAPSSPAPSSAAPSSARPTITNPPQVDPAGVCPDGRYVLTRFSGTGLGSRKLTGTGDDLKATFADGAYLMRAAGRSPYALVTQGSEKAELTLKGTMRGTYRGIGDKLTFKVAGAQGSAKLAADGQTRTLTMTQLTKTLAPSGQVPTTCTGDRMTIAMKTITLELEQV